MRRMKQLVLIGCLLIIICILYPNSGAISPTRTQAPQGTNTHIPTIPASATFTPPLLPTESPTTGVPCFVTYVDPFAFLPNSTTLLVRAIEGVHVFNLQTMQEESFIEAPSNLNGPVVALSPDGKRIAWSLEDGTIQIVRLSDQVVMTSIKSGQTSPIKLEFHPDGKLVYSASHDGWLKVWDLNGNLVNSFMPGGLDFMNFGLSADGAMLATIPSDGEITLWNADNFKIITGLTSSGGYDTSDVVFSPEGKYIAADLINGLYLWKMPDRTELMGAGSAINSMAVAYSPDGEILAYSNLNQIVLSSPDGTQTIRTMDGHQAPIFELVFSPDSSVLVSADGMEIRVWRVEDGELLAIGKSTCP